MAVSSSSAGFCYSANPAIQTLMENPISGSGFESSPEIFSRNHQQHDDDEFKNHDLTLVHDSSFRCVFPCEGNERPSQGLSLSLSSSNPSTIGLQSFELRNTISQEPGFTNSDSPSSRDGFFHRHQQQQGQFNIRNSKYLTAVQELLNEFCSLERRITDQEKTQRRKNWDDEMSSANFPSSRKQSALHSLEFMELQKRKTKLLSMLEQVDRRYKHYCDQIKAAVSSFEAVARDRTANDYLSSASTAMSRHFRSLKDGIIGQIYAIKKVMGEKDSVAPGTTRGETPRLKVVDQTLRQQRAMQQMNMMESHPWRPQRGLPERSVSVLRAWLFEHFLNPYPGDVDKHILARQTGLSRSQVSNWFINARVRLWKPMIEEMYAEEAKDSNSDRLMADLQDNNPEQKPNPDQLLRIDSECLSSIISTSNKNTCNNFGSAAFGAVDLDVSSCNHHFSAGVSYSNIHDHQDFNGGVSLTLGLQQNGESGVSLAFSPASQSSLFYPRDHIDDCQPVQYSILDSEFDGAQLLHDLAG